MKKVPTVTMDGIRYLSQTDKMLQADNICSNAVSNCIHALIEFTFCACLAA